MEVRADDKRVFMAFSLLFAILAVLSTQRLGKVQYYLQLLLLLFSSQVFGSKQSIFNSVFTTNIHMLPVKVA